MGEGAARFSGWEKRFQPAQAPMVAIVWMDAATSSRTEIREGDQEFGGFNPGLIDTTVGFYLGAKDGHALIAASFSSDSEARQPTYRNIWSIPESLILRRYNLSGEVESVVADPDEIPC